MSSGTKFNLLMAREVAEGLVKRLAPYCERIEIAGSIRRQKGMVGDIEILYIPKFKEIPSDQAGLLFPSADAMDTVNLMDENLRFLIDDGVIEPRLNEKGNASWGEKIKLATHLESGIPVDFFATSEASWWNYLVCRTGPAELNMRICQRAIKMEMKWEPYSPGFYSHDEGRIDCKSEREVFFAVGLPYLPPEERF